jgi:hypothetical protein
VSGEADALAESLLARVPLPEKAATATAPSRGPDRNPVAGAQQNITAFSQSSPTLSNRACQVRADSRRGDEFRAKAAHTRGRRWETVSQAGAKSRN